MEPSNKSYMFRDLQAAADMKKKSELGGLEEEFNIYGCAYYDAKQDCVCYKLSEDAEYIYGFVANSVERQIYPSNVATITHKCLVPSGTRSEMVFDLQIKLAEKLRNEYSKEFFLTLHQIAIQSRNNNAASALWNIVEDIEGGFDIEKLRNFEFLVKYMLDCNKLTLEEYKKILCWIQEEQHRMGEMFLKKDIFSKNIYALAYEKNGVIKYIINTQKEVIYKKLQAIEETGQFVMPIYTCKGYYNHTYKLPALLNDFKKEFAAIYDEKYMREIKKILNECTDSENKAYLDKEKERLSYQYQGDALKTLYRYIYRWHRG